MTASKIIMCVSALLIMAGVYTGITNPANAAGVVFFIVGIMTLIFGAMMETL